ncbi:MAG: DUF4158 domain-containing protein [Verrucomicrobia bacterium]|nr:DUF4158 domain-containing protein [Verrucomicrobiota bacterium]
MPIEFLNDLQRRSHGRFNAEPTPDQLARYFHLDDADRALIHAHRGDHNRLGFAVQLCMARFPGTFLETPSETPKGVIAFVGQQLGIRELTAFTEYCDGRTRKAHVSEIRRRYGFCDFSDRSGRFRLQRWLYALCWTGTDRPGVLFDRAVAWLITHKILLPGVTVLERLVARIRRRTHERVWGLLTQALAAETTIKLEALLRIPDGGHASVSDHLRKGPAAHAQGPGCGRDSAEPSRPAPLGPERPGRRGPRGRVRPRRARSVGSRGGPSGALGPPPGRRLLSRALRELSSGAHLFAQPAADGAFRRDPGRVFPLRGRGLTIFVPASGDPRAADGRTSQRRDFGTGSLLH